MHRRHNQVVFYLTNYAEEILIKGYHKQVFPLRYTTRKDFFQGFLLKLIIYLLYIFTGGKVLIVLFSNLLLQIQKEILMYKLFWIVKDQKNVVLLQDTFSYNFRVVLCVMWVFRAAVCVKKRTKQAWMLRQNKRSEKAGLSWFSVSLIRRLVWTSPCQSNFELMLLLLPFILS
jgi:hypothetical protein